MPFVSIFLIILWSLIIIFPNLISYFIWGLLLFIWVNLLILKFITKNKSQDSYIKFWKYKIYKD